MDDGELIRYILDGGQGRALVSLGSWFEKCPRFKTFTHRYRDKIRSKLRAADSENGLSDVRAELKFAYLMLLDDRFDVEYEKHGTGNKRSPDFTVVFQRALPFNAEIKRIRESQLSVRFERLVASLDREVRNVSSTLQFGIEPGVTGMSPGLLDRLERSKASVIDFIKATIRAGEGNLLPDKQYEYEVPGFGRDLILYLVKPARKGAPGPTSHDGIMPVPYTQREYRKLADTIFEKVGQLVPGMINILLVFCSSFTHEEVDVLKAVRSINWVLGQGGEDFFVRKGFAGKQDFLDHTKRLSGIVFRDSYVPVWGHRDRNFLWKNGQAGLEIPDPIAEYLSVMDEPQAGTSPRLG